MTLIRELVERPLDPGYAEAAGRRREAEAGGIRRTMAPATRVAVAVVAIILGAATSIAVAHLRQPQPAVLQARGVLERQITRQQERLAGLSAQADELSGSIESLQSAALANLDRPMLDLIRRDGLRDGTTPVAGPGLVVSLTNGAGATDGTIDANSLVRDQDVQRVVSALWAAGAEAISVDDQRLTVRTAIRNAGPAVLVNLVPLAGPTYVVRAIGDPVAMQASLARSDLEGYLQLLGSSYGIRSSVVTQSSLTLPGAGIQPLQHAQPVGSAP
jgi:uncharacterized protein YlxW (UPF0749 family)